MMDAAMMRTSLLIAVFSVCWARVSLAQPAPEDDFDEPFLIEHPTAVRVVRVKVVKKRCYPCAKRRPKRRSTHLDLQANIGYGGYYGALYSTRLHGPILSGAGVISWGRGTKIGIRLAGFYGRMSGEIDPFYGSNRELAASIFGGNIGVQATLRSGFWIAKSVGFVRYNDGQDEGTSGELVLAGGYALSLTEGLALTISAEAGYGFSSREALSLRGQAVVGLLLRL
jgi:hypothetical protein